MSQKQSENHAPARKKSINGEAFRCREVFDSDLAPTWLESGIREQEKSSGRIIHAGLMPKTDQGAFDVAKALNCYFEVARARRTQA
jgi:hypothetical protein